MAAVVLYFPFTGTYYSPFFHQIQIVCGLKDCGCRTMATKNILHMLPSTTLCIRKMECQLQMGNYRHSLMSMVLTFIILAYQVFTLYPCLTAVHVQDKQICILSDIIIGKQNPTLQCNHTMSECNAALQKMQLCKMFLFKSC